MIEDVIFIIQKVPHSKYAVRDEFSSRGSTLLNLIINKIRFTSFSTITESPDCFTATQRQSSEGSVDKKLSACGFSLWYHVSNLLVSSPCFHMSHYSIEDVVVKKFSATSCSIINPYRFLPQHFLYFLPEPHGHGSFLPIFFSLRIVVDSFCSL